ncbi:MAG: hypothetical protein HC838_13630 [Spirulinaceae cyanobacterium RM2_2_10]|nr:hypothetical protein [Spirulinaceae cyanobacterium RM2_2_10]
MSVLPTAYKTTGDLAIAPAGRQQNRELGSRGLERSRHSQTDVLLDTMRTESQASR